MPGRRRPSPAQVRSFGARRTRRSRTALAAVAALAGGAVFAVAGFLSGLLLDEHGGVVGALEWVLRTVVVVAAAVFVVAGALAVAGLARRVRPRPVGWLIAVAAIAAFAWFLAVPVGYAVYLTHLPSRADVRDADLGATKKAVMITGADDVRVRGWYVPSRNGAVVIALHGTGSSRLGVAGHTRLLVRHGYGVLALDLRGHGESDGRSTSAAWKLDEDLDAVVDWVAAQPDAEPARIGLVGVSLGGEVSVRVAARRRDVRAVVAEGAMGSVDDARAAGASFPVAAQIAMLAMLSTVLTGENTGSDGDLVERIAPRPLLLISAGSGMEADINRIFQRRGSATTEHWNLPAAAHGSALAADPEEYERRVVGFLDRTLRPARPGG